MDGEGDIGYTGSVAQAFDLQTDFGPGIVLLRVMLLDFRTQHHPDHAGLIQVGNRPAARQLAVLQHADPIGDLENLVDAMRDIQDRLALTGEPPDKLVEPLRLVQPERGGGFVHDKQG